MTPRRVAFRLGDRIIMSQFGGQRRRAITAAAGTFSVVLTRYRVGWLQRAGHRTLAFMTDRINPSGRVIIRQGTHDLPGLHPVGRARHVAHRRVPRPTGVKRADPPVPLALAGDPAVAATNATPRPTAATRGT